MELFGGQQGPLHLHDGVREIDVLGARGNAVELRVAAPDAVIVVENLETLGHVAVARIEKPEHGLVDGGGAQVRLVAAGDAADRVAGAASDAVAFPLGLLAELRVGADDRELFGVLVPGVQGGADFFPLGKKGAKVNDEVFADGEVGQGLERNGFRLDGFHAGLAGKPRHPVDLHRAGSAHSHAA